MLICVTYLLLVTSCLAVPFQPEVRTSFGLARGISLKSRDGRPYFSFTAIPFAQPPLANLRFKPPVAAGPWSSVLNATEPSPRCLQLKDGNVEGQEDCLYLNINTPKISASLPVLFYVHGGGFLIGNAGPPEKGSFFMDEDVVLVTLHYRLGIWGFLSLENEEQPGNMGLKDIALALTWVRSEIANFGGNPDLITAFGISAGGSAVHYLCSAPHTRNLLKGCISQSGVGGSLWSLKHKGDARGVALELAKSLDCPEEGLVSCLQNKTIAEIFGSLSTKIGRGFGPSIEPAGADALIREWPSKDSSFPWIVGHTANEGIIRSGYIANFQNSSALKLYLENYESYFTKVFHRAKEPKLKAKRIHDRFFLTNEPYTGVELLHSEAPFVYPALKEAIRHTGPKYFYVFNYTGGPSMWETITKRKLNLTGVCHGDDEPYLFNFPKGFKPGGWPSQEDIKFSKKLIKMWVNFARTQNPSINGELQWEQFGEGRYLHLSNDGITIKEYPKKNEIIEFWDSIFE